jgi:transcriptional regulator with GAF, ATPase, and Fis domain
MDPSDAFTAPDPTARATLKTRVRRAGVTLRWRDAGGAQDVTVDDAATLGSAVGSDVRMQEGTVSRLHARIEHRDDGPWIVDLDSTNGTTIDGIAVSGARLHDGARLGLGSLAVEVRLGVAETEVQLWPAERFGPLIGASNAMRELFEKLARIAPSDGTVLIAGETGTGKELVATAIHESSKRARGPLVVVDCGAIPESLFESELFGHVRGAFTGADRARDGAFQAAEGGTLFLDEIGELPLSMQPKLLRAIESRTVRRVGEPTHAPVDVRIVAATHRDLAHMVAAGAFREDHFFRLAVFPITVPPLRKRREDIPLLAGHFLAGRALEPAVLREIAQRPWLGNVRELRNFVERAATLGASEALKSMPTLGAASAGGALPEVPIDEPFKEVRERWLNHLEREYVRGWLERKTWNVSAAAEAMGVDRTYVHRLMRKHDLGR